MTTARDVRRARSRARRERQSLGDALYVIYVTVLFTSYPLAALGSRAAPRPGPVRSAAADVEPLLLAVAALAFVIGRAAAAVRGGPVVVPPEDARLLFTWPVPRAAVIVPALAAALSRAIGGALVVSAVLLYIDIRDLGSPARAALRDDLLLPPLIALVTVLVAWLVQVTPSLARLARTGSSMLAAAGFLGFCWAARQVGQLGFVPALRRIADVGPDPAALPFSSAASGSASTHGVIVAVFLLAAAVPLGLLSMRAAARATPEQMLSRSRRADVTRTALRLGFTSSVYLSRTEPIRRSRRRRLALPSRTAGMAVAAKAWLQEQGTPVLPRLLTCAAVTGAVVAAAAHVRPGPGFAATVVWGGLAAVGLTFVATRFADPVRLDVDSAPFVGSVPLSYRVVSRYDLIVSSISALAGASLGVMGAAALGLLAWNQLVAGLLGGCALAVLLAAAGALSALSNDPSPFMPPALALGYRTSGFIAITIACVSSALLLRAPAASGAAVQSRLPTAVLVTGFLAGVVATVTVKRAASALRRGR